MNLLVGAVKRVTGEGLHELCGSHNTSLKHRPISDSPII